MGMATPAPDASPGPMTPELAQRMRWEREVDERNRPLTDEELDAMIAEASTLVGFPRTAALQAIGRRIHAQAYIGFVGQLDLAYGVSSNIEWDVPLDHRFIVRNMGLAD